MFSVQLIKFGSYKNSVYSSFDKYKHKVFMFLVFPSRASVHFTAIIFLFVNINKVISKKAR